MNLADELTFSRTIVALFKNIVYKDANREHWDIIELYKHKIEDFVGKIGLTLIVDEMDGYAFLKQRTYSDDEYIPRLIPRHALSYELSLLLMVLRKQLLEFDSTTGDKRLILTKQQIVDRIKLYLKDTTNEVKLIESIQRNIERAESMGFLSRIKGNDESFEVMRIIRGFVNAEFLDELNKRLTEYQRFIDTGEIKEDQSDARI